MLAQINLFARFQTTSIWPTLILSSHLRVWFPSCPFPSHFPTKILYVFHIYLVRLKCPTHFVLFLSLCLNTPQPRTLFSTTHGLRPSFSVPDKVFVQLHEFIYPLSHRQLLPSSCNINLWMRSYLCKFTSIPYRIQYTIITCLKAFGLILCKVDARCLSVCLYSISHSENSLSHYVFRLQKHKMEQSSWTANGHSAGHQMHCPLCSPNVHYSAHKTFPELDEISECFRFVHVNP
jgi:hypothetical protein